MKKLLGILVLAFLFSGNANAGVNEPGIAWISGLCSESFSKEHEKLKKIYLESDKKINVVLYGSCNDKSNYSFGTKKGKNLEALHKKAYKACLEYAKEYTPGEDCYLYSVNEEVVWKYDKAKYLAQKEAKETKAKIELEKQAQIDKKPGRFFEDQPDVNDDYQIHFNYLLASDSKDREWDINGKMEKILLKLNKFMLIATAGHKYSGRLGKKYKFDFRKDGKIDITFIRLDKTEKYLMPYPNDYLARFLYVKMKMQNPKKIYYNLVEVAGHDGGEAGVPMGSTFLKNRHIKGEDVRVIRNVLHEFHHAQGGGFECVPGMGSDAHYPGNPKTRTQLQANDGKKIGSTYIHKVEGCPELADSVYLTPTSDQPYDPYELICKKNFGKYNLAKSGRTSFCKWYFLHGNSK